VLENSAGLFTTFQCHLKKSLSNEKFIEKTPNWTRCEELNKSICAKKDFIEKNSKLIHIDLFG
jgi:hypothetical protein